MKRVLNTGDVVIIACVLIVTGIMTLYGNITGVGAPKGQSEDTAAGEVVITADGSVWKRMPLNQNAVVVYESDGRRNTIEINNGGVRMSEAGCPDKLCVKQGIISDSRRIIVCLPNRVTISIENLIENNSGVDIIVNN